MYYIFIYRQVGIMTVTINTYCDYYKRAASFVHRFHRRRRPSCSTNRAKDFKYESVYLPSSYAAYDFHQFLTRNPVTVYNKIIIRIYV